MHQLTTSPGHSEPHAASAPRDLHVIEGTATVFVERESKRLTWVVQLPHEHDLRQSRPIKSGDFLVLTDQTGKVLFQGDILPKYHLTDPVYTFVSVPGQQVPPRGFEVSWHQEGWDPSAWASLFSQGNLHARIVRPSHHEP